MGKILWLTSFGPPVYGTNVLSHVIEVTSINSFNAVLNVIPSLQYNVSTHSTFTAGQLHVYIALTARDVSFWAQKPTTSRTSYRPSTLNISVHIMAYYT